MRRRSTLQITLVLIGSMLVAGGCGKKEERHVYKSKQDCLEDWGNDEKTAKRSSRTTPTIAVMVTGFSMGLALAWDEPIRDRVAARYAPSPFPAVVSAVSPASTHPLAASSCSVRLIHPV